MPIILNPKPYDLVDTKVGNLGVFWISSGHQDLLLKKIGGSVANSSPFKFARAIIPFICWPIDSLQDGQYKPESPVLTDEDITKLSESEIEEIAHKYIIHNEHLFKYYG